MTDKRAIRAAARAARDAFVAAPHPAIRVDSAFLTLLRSALIVASYVPIGSEADPAPLEHAARAAGCRLALPLVIDRATPIRFVHWSPDVALMRGPFGLWQPADDAEELQPDLILTPLVAFDRALNRVGQGAGHYDRAFAALPEAVRIGVAWSVQLVADTAADPWDAPLDAIATECDWLTR